MDIIGFRGMHSLDLATNKVLILIRPFTNMNPERTWNPKNAKYGAFYLYQLRYPAFGFVYYFLSFVQALENKLIRQ